MVGGMSFDAVTLAEACDRGDAGTYTRCSEVVATLSNEHLEALCHRLINERLERKSKDIETYFREANNDWQQAMYVLLLRVVCGSHNRDAAMELAKRVPYNIILRENSALINIEALLLGGSGLLHLYDDDYYVRRLKEEFDHLVHKYQIRAMDASEWQLSGMYINNHPTLRLAQIASCLHRNNLTMERLLTCKKRKDVHHLFSAQASEYWVENFSPSASHHRISYRIGSFKSDILGINVVVPLMYYYGNFTESYTLYEQALALLEDIPSEDNTYIRRWYMPSNSRGKSAFHSQALLQLSTEYCSHHFGKHCPLCAILQRRW